MRRRASLALTGCLVATCVAVVMVLSGSSATAAHRELHAIKTKLLGVTTVSPRVCQPDETVPAKTSAIRVWMEAVVGPPITVQVLSGSHLLAHGKRDAGWTAGAVSFAVPPLPTRQSHVIVCLTIHGTGEPVGVQGVPSPTDVAARTKDGSLGGRLVIEYLKPGHTSWWARVRTVVRHMGLGHAFTGPAVAIVALLLMLAVTALMSRAILRDLS
jgi:hypothetical protein